MALRSCASKLITSSQSIFSNSDLFCSPTFVRTEKFHKNHPCSSTAFIRRATRGIHSTSVTRMGGHGHDEPFDLHAKHMYNLGRMSNQKLKMTLGVRSAVAIGVIVPVYAIVFQQKKTASG